MLLNRPQVDHADLGLIEFDNTEDLRPQKKDDSRAATPESSETHHSAEI